MEVLSHHIYRPRSHSQEEAIRAGTPGGKNLEGHLRILSI